jgi:hypothetical protein
MNYLKKLALAFTVLSVLTVASVAGETNSPTCAPGETSTPPCSSQAVTDDSTGDMNTPPSNEVDLTTVVEVVQLALSLF